LERSRHLRSLAEPLAVPKQLTGVDPAARASSDALAPGFIVS
jgi:hypothetical protein